MKDNFINMNLDSYFPSGATLATLMQSQRLIMMTVTDFLSIIELTNPDKERSTCLAHFEKGMKIFD